MQANRLIKGLATTAIILAYLLVSACTSVFPIQPGASGSQASSASQRAEQAIQRGDYRRAAELYGELGDENEGDTADSYHLLAAKNFFAAEEIGLSKNRLSKIQGDTPETTVATTVLNARIDLTDNAPEAAILKLASLDEIPDELRPDVLEVQGQAQFMEGATANAVATLIDREVWLSEPEDVLTNQRIIWDGLATQETIEIPEDRDSIVKGWLELGRLHRDLSRNPFELETKAMQWGLENPEHPASTGLLVEILGNYRSVLEFPDQIALLLPLSDRLKNTGAAIRDGFLAGYFQHSATHQKPRVKVYDVTKLGVVPAFDQARLDGAGFVVGPLTKRSVEELVQHSDGSTPILSLNYLAPSGYLPANFFQFGLAPEDEAQQAALRVLQDGHNQGIALVPANNWGTRLINAFASELESQGGSLLAYQTYNPRERDYTVPITGLLHLNESRQRKRNLAGITGLDLEFEPRRRYDAQFIFVAADAPQARLLRPQLKFHYASRLPIYATSSVYAPDEKANRELNGVMFPDMPWSLIPDNVSTSMKNAIQTSWPPGSIRRGRLYAMGFDAYRLIPLLTNADERAGAPIPGLTGELELVNGRVFRHLAWAQFVKGVPEFLPALPETQTDDQ